MNKEALEDQFKVKQRLQNPEIINQAENEKQLKALLDQINKFTEKEKQHGSELDVDHGLGSDPRTSHKPEKTKLRWTTATKTAYPPIMRIYVQLTQMN